MACSDWTKVVSYHEGLLFTHYSPVAAKRKSKFCKRRRLVSFGKLGE
jgi:hypothetical protein